MKRKHSRGFGLLLTLFGMGFAVLTLGAAVDISHIYLVHSELASATDELALSSARQLDGSAKGLERARNVAINPDTRHELEVQFTFSTDRLGEMHTEFSTAPGGPWVATPRDASEFRFVRVSANADVPLFFFPLIPTARKSQGIAAVSVAGQLPAGYPARQRVAYTVSAPDPKRDDYGFARNQSWPLRLARPGDCGEILAERFRLDTDTASRNYEDYRQLGNGWRVVYAAVSDGAGPVAGYATFLIEPDIAANGECKAAYAGNAPVLGAARDGAGAPGLYEVRLVP